MLQVFLFVLHSIYQMEQLQQLVKPAPLHKVVDPLFAKFLLGIPTLQKGFFRKDFGIFGFRLRLVLILFVFFIFNFVLLNVLVVWVFDLALDKDELVEEEVWLIDVEEFVPLGVWVDILDLLDDLL